MSELLDLRIHILQDKNDFDDYSRVEEYTYIFKKDKELSMYEIFDNRMKYIMAGRDDNCLGMLFEIIFSQDACEQNPDYEKAIHYCRDYFADLYKYENILGAFIKEAVPAKLCFYVFPLKGRRLTPSAWIDINRKIRVGRKEEFLSNLAKELNIKKSNKEVEIENLPPLNQIKKYTPQFPRTEETEVVSIYETHSIFDNLQTTLSKTLIAKRFDETLRYFTGAERRFYNEAQSGHIAWETFQERVEEYLKKYHVTLTNLDKEYILRKMNSAVYGYYILDDLIDDEAISDIKIISCDNVRVKVGNGRYTSNLKFLDERDMAQFIQGVASRNNLSLNHSGIFVFTDKDTSPKFRMRFNLTTGEINSNENYYLHIRKIRKDKYSLQDLIHHKMMPEHIAEWLKEQAMVSKGLVFCGKGASGKTTLMNVLLEHYPKNSSGLVIQESEELFSDTHPDLMFQHITPNYSLSDLARNGLLTDLDLFVIGEIKGAEALYFLNACSTGHKCWCSVHSSSSLNAIDKLADYVMYESKYDKVQAEEMLKDLETIVFMKNFKVEEISRITGWDSKNLCLTYDVMYKRME